MKSLRYIYTALLCFTLIACKDDFGDTDLLSNDVAPKDVVATFKVKQDNSGEVTIVPTATGAVLYQIYFGDSTTTPTTVQVGEAATHTYAEGKYNVKVIAQSLSGKQTELIQPLEVSFNAPGDLKVKITNDTSVSKKVNVTATATYGITFDVYFGEKADEKPVSGNIGSTISHVYAAVGTYTITVEVKGAGSATTKHTQAVQVTALSQPTASAATPPARYAADVVSIFSNSYTNLSGTDFNPNWGQATQYTAFALSGNDMLQYAKLNYQGIQFANATDLTAMQYLHLDVWASGVNSLEIFLISKAGGAATEKKVTKTLKAEQWLSIDIPLTDYTSQGLTVDDIHQIKLVGDPAGGTVFIDNLYFYRKSNSVLVENFEGTAPALTSFGGMADAKVVANPDASGANTTKKVVQFTKTAGAETWAGTFFETSALKELPTYSKLHLMAYSPKKGVKVLVKLEGSDSSINHEVSATTTAENTWEELTFDFSKAPQAEYLKVVVFFDFGNQGDGTTYYYDEIKLTK